MTEHGAGRVLAEAGGKEPPQGERRDRRPRGDLCIGRPGGEGAAAASENRHLLPEQRLRGAPQLLDPASLEAETDHCLCGQIRHQYRALINSVQQNREDILNASDRLTEVLEEANTLFNGVSRAREAVLDAHFLVLASDLGKEKAKQLRSDLNSFDMLRYVETLLTHMGVNPLEAEELVREDDSPDFEFIVYDSWRISGKTAENTFNKTHTFHFLLGSIQGECPVPKPRAERPRRICALEKEREMPVQLKRMEESQQEATEKEVERILGLLQTYFREDPDTPMSFFDFVVDPHSFPRTVENIFHVSFIVRDGFARIKLDQDRLPIIEPVNINEESEGIDQNTQIRNQGIIALSYRDWEEIVRTFEISEPVIVSGPSRQSLSADGS
ncbi:LOW QUALITY PROTEIN: non-structural maintenance of chromosomes element 4 homolog A [Myotis lucifugus]|uniref:LOW QUALITY PROTEIN: non-structural maintenance of chromosomes element 4 homolog A n=1 Tax=Myotis lucifugus TaxID=59463 RepID=UPI0006D70485|nr:LOW QUALITY PROTEIN: non-structural maintenance of chromosomes element 4 homolog A [Myotis lucifugus]